MDVPFGFTPELGLQLLEAQGVDTTITRKLLAVDLGIRAAAVSTLISAASEVSRNPGFERTAKFVDLMVDLIENFTDMTKTGPTVQAIVALIEDFNAE